ncbi:hypothetical protein GQ473_00795 [archaeon]|nr:hypothetical protein [archaeon]
MDSNLAVKISPDIAKAKSLKDTATGRIEFLNRNDIDANNANYIFEGYYSSALEMIHAIVIIKGYKVSNHICLGYYIRDILKNDELYRVFDNCRFKRNSLVYYGRKMSIEIAKESIKKCILLIEQLNVIFEDEINFKI